MRRPSLKGKIQTELLKSKPGKNNDYCSLKDFKENTLVLYTYEQWRTQNVLKGDA